MGGWWRWALVSPDGVAPSRMVSVSASVNLPLYHEVQKFSSGTGSPRWSQKKGRKMVVVVVVNIMYIERCLQWTACKQTDLGVHLAQVMHDAIQVQFTCAQNHMLT